MDRILRKPKPKQHSAGLMLVLQLESVGLDNLTDVSDICIQFSYLTQAG